MCMSMFISQVLLAFQFASFHFASVPFVSLRTTASPQLIEVQTRPYNCLKKFKLIE